MQPYPTAVHRPQKLSEYVGQKTVVSNLSTFIGAALKRKQCLDHVLLSGPPGMGKTTLAYILATEMGAAIKPTTGPLLDRQGDLAAILTGLQPGDILFIDEIHRMPSAVEEVLYSAMEDYRLDVIIGQGPMAKTVRINLAPFTLVGATTRSGLLTAPLRDRFGILARLDGYDKAELEILLSQASKRLDIRLNDAAISELALRSQGTPRIAIRLLRRVRDFAEKENCRIITQNLVDQSLHSLGIDRHGLNNIHRELLSAIINKFNGGPVGLSTLTAAINESHDAIETVYEPFLIKEGFVQKTPRGRIATPKARECVESAEKMQQSLL